MKKFLSKHATKFVWGSVFIVGAVLYMWIAYGVIIYTIQES